MSDIFVTSVLLPLAVGLISAILAYMLARKKAAVEPEKIKAETAALLTTGYEKLVQDYQEQIASMRTEIEKLQRRQDETSTEYMAMLREDQGEIESLRGGMRDLERLITRLSGETTELRKALTVAEARITELEKENTMLRSDNLALAQELAQYRGDGNERG